MKQLLIRLLRLVGLVTAGRYQLLKTQVRDLESRIKKLAALVDESRAESKEWKAKAAEAEKQATVASKQAAVASKQAASMERQASHQAARVEKLTVECGKLREDLKHARATQHELEALRARLSNAERDLAGSREHLMAVEVKLDILEGAANVLDARTRSVISQRDRETGVPV